MQSPQNMYLVTLHANRTNSVVFIMMLRFIKRRPKNERVYNLRIQKGSRAPTGREDFKQTDVTKVLQCAIHQIRHYPLSTSALTSVRLLACKLFSPPEI